MLLWFVEREDTLIGLDPIHIHNDEVHDVL